MTASCYGVQLLSFRDRLAQEESRKSGARNDELKAAGRLAAEIAHQLKNPLASSIRGVLAAARDQGGKERFQPPDRDHPRGDRAFRSNPDAVDGLRAIERRRVEKLNLGEELDRAIAEVLPAGANYAIKIQREYAPNLPAV